MHDSSTDARKMFTVLAKTTFVRQSKNNNLEQVRNSLFINWSVALHTSTLATLPYRVTLVTY